MSEMVERVARAIADHPINWRDYEREARAAIAAMREPTEGMWRAGVYEPGYVSPEAWQAMIDAALSEEPQNEMV